MRKKTEVDRLKTTHMSIELVCSSFYIMAESNKVYYRDIDGEQ